MDTIRDRVKEFRRVPISNLHPHPHNWRRHPSYQRRALRELLGDVGFADAILARETPEGLEIIDGHLRVEEMPPDAEVPVLVLDVTEAEAEKLLLTLDPLAAMADTDTEVLGSLLSRVDVPGSLDALLRTMADVPAEDGFPDASLDGLEPARSVAGYDFKLDPGKLGWRLEAVRSCQSRALAIELFAGKGVLSYWYRRAFDRVITVDTVPYPGIDYSMHARDYLSFVFDLEADFDLVDFDDEGCPSAEIQSFFRTIADRDSRRSFVLCLTDGLGLWLKRRSIDNLRERYLWGEDIDSRMTREVYALWPSLVEHHLVTVASEAGYRAERINLARGSANNVVYAAYSITRT